MTTSSPLFIHGGTVLSDGLAAGDVAVAGGLIHDIDGTVPRGAMMLNASGLFVLPGIIDAHGDAFERHLMPRPKVSFDPNVALFDADRALVANGVTTAFHGLTVSWEPGLRSAQMGHSFLMAFEQIRSRLAADTHVHLRHETFHLDGEGDLIGWLVDRRVGVLAFNDHIHQVLKAREEPAKAAAMAERSGVTADQLMQRAEAAFARRDDVSGSIVRIADAARQAGIPIMSHDDNTPQVRQWFRSLGASIAEFPMNEATASEAATHGEAVVLGAPNVVRGGSHTGCVSAAQMVAKGLCTILASDYYYASLPLAPFILARAGDVDFARAWSLVSRGPADALGLADRGVIARGYRADLILVAPDPQPRVMATIVGGRLVHLADGGILG